MCFLLKYGIEKISTGIVKYESRIVKSKPDDVIITKEMTKIKSSSEGENMQTQYSMLGYGVDIYFHDYKLAIEIDENGHSDRNIDYKIKKSKSNRYLCMCMCMYVDYFSRLHPYMIKGTSAILTS